MAGSSPSAPAVAFFGATGGCTLACLALALSAGYPCTVCLGIHLVRSSAKLHALLEVRQPPVPLDTLMIIEGNVKDPSSVAKALVTGEAPTPVDIVVSGIGGTPVFKPNPLRPTLNDPTVCQDATATILSSLRSLQCNGIKPLLVVISTTGISSTGRDIPLAMIPLYHWLLAVPHKDKKAMESILVDEMHKEESERAIGGFVAVRPSLLTNGVRKGTDKVRVGTEVDGEGKHAVGYTISREDVGGWMFDEIVNRTAEERAKWIGKMLSITY